LQNSSLPVATQCVVRPIVRSFSARFVREAAAHVRTGGHAVLWESTSSARLVVPPPARGDDSDLGAWAIFDLELRRWSVSKAGPLRGLAAVSVPKDRLAIVRARAERDSVWPGPTRVMRLDCLSCAACCVHNRVVLERADVTRLARGGRPEVAKAPFARRAADGKIVLVLTRTKRCKQLGEGNACAVYAIRPRACVAFPVASECCLSAREDELGVVDGVC
jgi:hypothetical protein